MSIIAYIESSNREPKKSAYEVISYAKNISDQLSTELIVVAINVDNTNEISNYGPDKIIIVNNQSIKNFNPKIINSREILSKIEEAGVMPFDFDVTGASLETVFLSITQKK